MPCTGVGLSSQGHDGQLLSVEGSPLGEAAQGWGLPTINLYKKPLWQLVGDHELACQRYSDDTHLNASFTSNRDNRVFQLSPCLPEISTWMNSGWLKLSLHKTVMMLVGGEGTPSFFNSCMYQTHWPSDRCCSLLEVL